MVNPISSLTSFHVFVCTGNPGALTLPRDFNLKTFNLRPPSLVYLYICIYDSTYISIYLYLVSVFRDFNLTKFNLTPPPLVHLYMYISVYITIGFNLFSMHRHYSYLCISISISIYLYLYIYLFSCCLCYLIVVK